MSGLKYFERPLFVNELIAKERTGNPSTLATKLEVSERTIYRIIEDLRLYYDGKIDIHYINERNSYVFIKKISD
jgi:predicted DNA-binding transcriptional regulator YafY